jgi:hypothetical protein
MTEHADALADVSTAALEVQSQIATLAAENERRRIEREEAAAMAEPMVPIPAPTPEVIE